MTDRDALPIMLRQAAITILDAAQGTPSRYRQPFIDQSKACQDAAEALTISQDSGWRPIETAPKDGSAVLGFRIHSGPQSDAQRGVKAGDHWWSIMLWDCWRNPDSSGWGERSLWVFAKDGKPTWSQPTHWQPLPTPPGDRPMTDRDALVTEK